MNISDLLICRGVKTLYPATPEFMTLSTSIWLDPFQIPLIETLSHLDDASENNTGLFLILLLNSAIIFDLSWHN